MRNERVAFVKGRSNVRVRSGRGLAPGGARSKRLQIIASEVNA
jgi:hypothetical protein